VLRPATALLRLQSGQRPLASAEARRGQRIDAPKVFFVVRRAKCYRYTAGSQPYPPGPLVKEVHGDPAHWRQLAQEPHGLSRKPFEAGLPPGSGRRLRIELEHEHPLSETPEPTLPGSQPKGDCLRHASFQDPSTGATAVRA